jgi:hypothetical protein
LRGPTVIAWTSRARALDVAAEHGILAPIVHELSVSAIVERWADPRWEALIAAV